MRSARPLAIRARSSTPRMPMPGWTIAAVAAQVRATWFWIRATRAAFRPTGGPSWISMPVSDPGRSTPPRSSACPREAWERNRVQPASPPIAKAVLAVCVLPVLWALSRQAWASAAVLLLVAGAVAVVTVVPVRGRSALGWLLASTAFAIGGLAGWTRFRSQASRGQADDLAPVDLPGSLSGIEIHEGPPVGLNAARVALIQN